MKRSLFVVLVFLFIPFPAYSQVPIEPGAVIDDGMEDPKAVIREMVALVHSNGWRCDSVSSAMRKLAFFNPSKFGFKLSCNGFRYEYEIRNRGGTWVACIDKCDF